MESRLEGSQAFTENSSGFLDLNEKNTLKQESLEGEIGELLAQVEDFTPALPEAAVRYFLSKSGFSCNDERVIKVISLAAQKFVTDIATDSFHFCKARSTSQRDTGKSGKTREKRYVLTVDDLSSALRGYGINCKKPRYFM
eukprot:Sdes_comp22655_c0_seq1m21077